MPTPTIQEIEEATLAKSPYFFSAKTLKFFGQTMRSFKVCKSPQGKVFIYAKMVARSMNIFRGYSFWEFTGDDLHTPKDEPDIIGMGPYAGLQALLKYIKEH
jgi:hypothetical protein